MAINQLHFSDLKDGCCKKTVVAQLLRFWDLKKVGEHLGLDLVFLDKKVSENEQLMALANTNVDFPDVCGIKTTLTMKIRPFNVLLWYLLSFSKIPKSASESLQQATIPRCIQDIIVQNLTFQLKLSEIHFSSTVIFLDYIKVK
ncbi:hypothetical protein Bca52824_052506 [Brassica carinata]|uniref:Uncharacterized protein n=1 Tax=Brassica carinata TaxID=52824 RepID=A0A8X7UMD6_BRACI|nr:hypothetical protein Bca52824_052506 [Brassica carinata]